MESVYNFQDINDAVYVLI